MRGDVMIHADECSASFDGYVRMTLDRFALLDFPQKLSWIDASLCDELLLDGIFASVAGRSEWSTNCACKITIGWVWFERDGRRVIAPGGISGNVMLVDPTMQDFGPARTSLILEAWLSADGFDTQSGLFKH
jgi:hypothetical protein